MTDMQGILFPPLDDESSHSSTVEASESPVLSKDLKDRFSKVRSVLREKAAANDEDAAAELKRKQEQVALEAARAVQEEVARLQNGIEELEAMYAMQQRQQQQHHLHQLLHDDDEEVHSDEEDDGQPGEVGNNDMNNNNNNNGIVFPALPSVVNAVEPDVDLDDSGPAGPASDEASATESGAVVTAEQICAIHETPNDAGF